MARTRQPPPAPGNTDTVSAMLTPGEFVMKRGAVQRIGLEKLKRMNQGYQEGGPVEEEGLDVPPDVQRAQPVPGRVYRAAPVFTSGSYTVAPPAPGTPFGYQPEQGLSTQQQTPVTSETRQDIKGTGPASIRYNNPGAMWPGESSRKFGATTYGVIGGGNRIANFATPEAGAAAQFDLLASPHYLNRTVGDVIGQWSGETGGQGNVEAYIKSLGLKPTDKITTDLLRSPQGIGLVQSQAKWEAGREYPMTPDQWQNAQNMAFGTLAAGPAGVAGFQQGGLVTPAEAAALQTAGQYAGTRDVLTPQNAPQYGLDPSTGFVARGTPSAPPTPPKVVPNTTAAPAQPSPVPAPTPPAPVKDDASAYPGSVPADPKKDEKDESEDYPGSKKAEDTELRKRVEAVQKQVQKSQAAGAEQRTTFTPSPQEEEPGYEGSTPAGEPQAQPKPVPQPQPQAQPTQQPVVPQASGGVPTFEQLADLPSAQLPPNLPTPKTAPAPPTPPEQPPAQAQPESMEAAQKRYEAERARLGIEQPPQPSQQQPAAQPPETQNPEGIADFFRKRGDQPITSDKDSRLATVSVGDQKWRVNNEAAPYFQGFLSALEANGAPISSSGGWVYRQKVGASGISEHAFGGAIDVNQTGRNEVTPEFRKWIDSHPGVLQELEKQWHIYGGERFGDLGHFEWGGTPTPGIQRDQSAGLVKQLNASGLNTTHFGYKGDPNLDDESKAGHGKYQEHMIAGYDVALNAAAAAKVGNPKPGSEFTYAGRKWRYGDKVPEKYSDARFDVYDPSGDFAGIGGGGGGGEKGVASISKDIQWPAGGIFGGQPLFSIGVQGGGGGSQPPEQAPRSFGGGGGDGDYSTQASVPSGGANVASGLGNLLAGVGLSSILRGRQAPQAAPQFAPQTAPPEEEDHPMVTALMNRGFTRQQALDFAQSSLAITPGKGLPPLTGGQAPAGPPAAPSTPAPAKLLPPSAPGGGVAASQAGLADALKALQSMGFKPKQAQGMLTKATGKTASELLQSALKIHQQGKGGAVPQQRPPAAPGGALPAAKPTPQQPGPLPQTTQPPREPVAGIRPHGSTVGVARPPGSEAISKWPRLVDQARQHASILSPDDPRVKKQADGMIKGEHFVAGDPLHDQLLNGLPGGQGGRQRGILGEAEAAIAEKRPMHISYISAPKEAERYPTRESRTLQYEEHSPEARLMGTTEGQLVGHSFIPTAVGIKPASKASEPTQAYVQGLSSNVLSNNFEHANQKLLAMGRKTPFAAMDHYFLDKLHGYFSNLNAGHVATGQGFPVGTSSHPNDPDTSHVPHRLSRNEADFIGLIVNNLAAHAKHQGGKDLRELARVNGALITPEGETNRLRHQIEEAEPGWTKRILEPSIRSFKVGLIHDLHPSEEFMPESIRPGTDYQNLTRTIAKTSHLGRPDVPIAASLHTSLTQNKAINEIERGFSEGHIGEHEARMRLQAIGENPSEYRFVSGSGGLIAPFEDSGESLSPSEHNELKANLRKQWIGGKVGIEDYRRKVAEVPLPEKPDPPKDSGETQVTPSPPEPEDVPSPAGTSPAQPDHATPRQGLSSTASSSEKEGESATFAQKPKRPVSTSKRVGFGTAQAAPPEPETEEETEKPETEPEPAKPAKLGVKTPLEEETEEGPPAAPGAGTAFKPPAKKPAKVASPQEEKEKTYKEMSPKEQEDYVSGRVKDRLANQIQGAVKLRPVIEEGKYKRDDAGNPQWEKDNYDLVNSPILGNKRLDRAKDQKFKDQEDIYDKSEHAHLNDIDRKRLSYLEQKSAVDTMSDKIVDAYQHMVNEPSVMAAKGWYTTMQQKLKKAFGPDAEIFAQLLGATSARTGVHQNFIQALDAYDQLQNRNFDNHIAKYNEAHEHLAKGEGALAKHMHDSGIVQEMLDKGTMPIDKKTGKPKELKTDAAAMAAWIAHHDILPRQKNGQKFNANSNQVLKVLAQKWLQSVKAPKTPNFAGNLSGRTREATIDVWAARFLHELGNEGNKKPWLLQPGGESGVRGLDFSFSQRAMRKAADKLGLSPDDLQAIGWYHQKHLWDRRGHTKGQGAKKASFDETFDKIFSPSGERMTDEEARKAFAGEKDEPVEEEEEAA